MQGCQQQRPFEHPDGNEAQPDRKVDGIQAQKPLGLDLRVEFAQVGNRADHQLREEAHESAVPEEGSQNRFLRTHPAQELRDVLLPGIGIREESRLVERVEGNACGDRNACDIDHQPGARTKEKHDDLVFEIAQGDDVIALAKQIYVSPPLALLLDGDDRDPDNEVDDQRYNQKNSRAYAMRDIEDDR